MFAPRWASFRDIAAPIPRLAPVTVFGSGLLVWVGLYRLGLRFDGMGGLYLLRLCQRGFCWTWLLVGWVG